MHPPALKGYMDSQRLESGMPPPDVIYGTSRRAVRFPIPVWHGRMHLYEPPASVFELQNRGPPLAFQPVTLRPHPAFAVPQKVHPGHISASFHPGSPSHDSHVRPALEVSYPCRQHRLPAAYRCVSSRKKRADTLRKDLFQCFGIAFDYGIFK